jgi:Ras-related GTP-binding protein C/D
MDFQVWDLPGHLNYLDPAFDTSAIFSEIGALIWVIDAQDDYFEAVARLNATILNLQTTYPNISVNVFVHKVDGLSDDYRVDTYQDIIHRVHDELMDAGYDNPSVKFHQTSIYDHSIFEAFSSIIQKLIPEIGTLESLLSSLCRTCKMEKAYLFDVLSKIYIASDDTPSRIGDYEVCSDYIDVVVDVSEIYGWDRTEANDNDPRYEGVRDDGVDAGGENGNQDAESLIIMEKKLGNYLYLKEINR